MTFRLRVKETFFSQVHTHRPATETAASLICNTSTRTVDKLRHNFSLCFFTLQGTQHSPSTQIFVVHWQKITPLHVSTTKLSSSKL